MSDHRLITALDVPSISEAEDLVDAIGEACGHYKIGLQLLPVGGMALAHALKARDKKVFLDYKLHDIPATVEKATRSIATVDADLLTVHAEPPVMRAAVEGREDFNLKLLGVTVLTAYDDDILKEIGYHESAHDLVLRRVEQALECGMDGVVASAQEAQEIRTRFGSDFMIVTPGIRPEGADKGDQKRVVTPKAALEAGSTHLVIGRPINQADNPKQAAESILSEIESVQYTT